MIFRFGVNCTFVILTLLCSVPPFHVSYSAFLVLFLIQLPRSPVSVASLSSLPLTGVSIWFRGELDVLCQSISTSFRLPFPPDFDLCNHCLGIHLILFSVSSATAVLFFGLYAVLPFSRVQNALTLFNFTTRRPPGTIVAFLSRLAIFQFIVGVELGLFCSNLYLTRLGADFSRLTANSYVFPYVLGETDEAVVGPNALGVILLAFVALVQSVALVVLRKSLN